MKQLIVNADDLGLCGEVTRGILEAHRHGIVTSASMLVTTPGFEVAASTAGAEPALGVGLHLDLTLGNALSSGAIKSSLVDGGGRFCLTPGSLALEVYRRKISLEVIREEWGMQLERFCSSGLSPTHVDSEKHVHMIPALFPVAAEIAGRAGARAIRLVRDNEVWRSISPLSARWYKVAVLWMMSSSLRARAGMMGLSTSEVCLGVAGHMPDKGKICRMLSRIPEGLTELVCHPGYEGPGLKAFGSLRYRRGIREHQLRILTDPDLIETVRNAKIRLVHYGIF